MSKSASIESQVAALSALQSRLSAGSFALGFVGNLSAAAVALKDILAAKTADHPESRAKRISEAGEKYLRSVHRTKAEIDQREMGGLAALSQQFAERVNLNLEGYRWATQITETFRTANQTEKVTMLSQIVESGDGRAMAALVEAPPYVHGVDPEMLQRFKSAMEAKFAPDIQQKRERFHEDLQASRAAISIAEQIAQSALDVENVEGALKEAEKIRLAEEALGAATA